MSLLTVPSARPIFILSAYVIEQPYVPEMQRPPQGLILHAHGCRWKLKGWQASSHSLGLQSVG